MKCTQPPEQHHSSTAPELCVYLASTALRPCNRCRLWLLYLWRLPT